MEGVKTIGLRRAAMKLAAVSGYTGGRALPAGGMVVTRLVLLLLDATGSSVITVAAAAAEKWSNTTFTDWIGVDPVCGVAEAGVFLPSLRHQPRTGPAAIRARRAER